MKKLIYLVGIISFLCSLPACRKDLTVPSAQATKIYEDHQDQSLVNVKLTSQSLTKTDCSQISQSNIEFSSVNIDIQKLRVFGPVNGWHDLAIKAGVYDLISLQNEIGALVTENTLLRAGSISSIQFIFGNNHSIVAGGQIHCLKLTSSLYEFDTNFHLGSGTVKQLTLLFDFCNIKFSANADKSSCYILDPIVTSKNFEEIIL